MAKKSTPDDFRRLIGYLIVTFLAIFVFFPFIWLANLWGGNEFLYYRWGIISIFLALFNLVFYYWRYPQNWFRNLLALGGLNLFTILIEYIWLTS